MRIAHNGNGGGAIAKRYQYLRAAASASFRQGYLSAYDLFGVASRLERLDVSDIELMRSDWNAVGDDIKEAISTYKTTNVE